MQGPSAGIWLDTAAVTACVLVLGAWVALADLPPSFRQVLGAYPRCDSLRFDVEVGSGGVTPDVSHYAVDCNGNQRMESDEFTTVINSRESALLRLDHRARRATRTRVDARMLQDAKKPAGLDLRFVGGRLERLADTQLIDGRVCWGWEYQYRDLPLEVWASANGEVCEVLARSPAGEATARLAQFRYHQDFPSQTFSTEVPAGYTLGDKED